MPKFFGLHAQLSRGAIVLWGLLPFVLLVGLYLTMSYLRHIENPQDKLLPSVSKMVQAVDEYAFTESKRTGEYMMLTDTVSSLRRIALGMTLAAVVGLFAGLHMGLLPGMQALMFSFVTFVSMVPPLSILPILFIAFGVDELAKVMLIFIGIFPVITRDVYLAVQKIPRQQIVKALTLGASQFQVAYRIVVPQVMPRLIDAVRLSLGAAWLFLIASEAIASTDGLGYRIFLVRRYLAMDVIIPYVLWITFLGFSMDWILRKVVRCKYFWYLER